MSHPTVATMLNEVITGLDGILDMMDWGEDEIDIAMKNDPDHADQLYHSFHVLVPTSELMHTEFVYRSHCKEMLARVVAGDDPRPPTNAEVAIGCSQLSMAAPLPVGATTVYMRVWRAAFPDHPSLSYLLPHYEHVAGARADRFEAQLRRELRQADRVWKPPEPCGGWHHGVQVACRYAKEETA